MRCYLVHTNRKRIRFLWLLSGMLREIVCKHKSKLPHSKIPQITQTNARLPSRWTPFLYEIPIIEPFDHLQSFAWCETADNIRIRKGPHASTCRPICVCVRCVVSIYLHLLDPTRLGSGRWAPAYSHRKKWCQKPSDCDLVESEWWIYGHFIYIYICAYLNRMQLPISNSNAFEHAHRPIWEAARRRGSYLDSALKCRHDESKSLTHPTKYMAITRTHDIKQIQNA